MAKRKKKHKKLNRNKFIRKYCKDCILCASNGSAYFCYDCIFKENPQIFIHDCWPKLRRLDKWPKPSYEETRLFKNIFCKSNSCNVLNNNNGSCRHEHACMNAFRQQIGEYDDYDDLKYICGYNTLYDKNFPFGKANKRNKKQKKGTFDVKVTKSPTMVFMTNDNADWTNFIRSVIANNDNQQTTT